MTREHTKSAERMSRDELADVLRGGDFRGLGADFGHACKRLADAVRALPVIATCGECRWCHATEVCMHPRAHAEREIDGCAMPPPSWCPLRGKR